MNRYIQKAIDVTLQKIKDENGKPIPMGILINKIKDTHPNIRKNDIYIAVDYLIEEKFIRRNYLNKLVIDYIELPADYSQYYEGTLVNLNNTGNGFVSYQINETEKETYFVHNKNLMGALIGDKVLFVKLIKEIVDPEKDLVNVKITKILERPKLCYTASYFNHDIKMDDTKFYLTPILDKRYDIPNGSKVLLEIKENDNKECIFSLKKIIGKIGTKGVDIDSIILDSGFKLKFDEEINKISEDIKWEVSDKDLKIRKNIKDRHIISIDPADSKDMDDAIYVEKLDNGNFFLSVSIADVSHYVKQDSKLDIDALSKCTSVYLVDRVLPMLHHNLSNNLCSLNPHVERFCLTCDMIFNNKGEVISKEIYPAIMINHDRLSYDIVNEYFETKNVDLSSKTLKVLDDGYELYSIIRNKKYKEGYVDLDIKEPRIICDSEGNPVDIFFKPRGHAQKMIEDFMIACNEAVTVIANELNLPFIYRVHDKPDIIKITKLTTELKKLKFKNSIVPGQEITPMDITNLLEANKDSINLDMLNILILKSMQKAQYSTNNIGHFGLASQQYTHFTSPIRRYSDLIVHRIFWMFLFDKDSYSNEQRQTLINRLENDADLCNKKEILAVELERDVMSYKIAEYMEKFINKTFEAKITTVTSFGFFVELDNTVEGLVSINSLDDDYYTYEPEEMILIGKKTQRIYTMGMTVKVKLVGANKFSRKIDFIIEGNKNENTSY